MFVRCLASNPGAHEKVEGEVVNPTRQQKPGIGEQLVDVAEAAEPAFAAAPENEDQHGVADGENERNYPAGNNVAQQRVVQCDPTAQHQPAGHGGVAHNAEKQFWRHPFPPNFDSDKINNKIILSLSRLILTLS